MNDTHVALDEHFARLMIALDGRNDPAIGSAARTVSAWRRAGHVCVSLAALEISAEALRGSPVVGAPGEWKPLILDPAGRLYLQRYWQYETDLADSLHRRLTQSATFDRALLAKGLKTFLSEDDADQRRAAETAVERRFCVITGGPGTGKTHTIAIILALLQAQADSAGQPFRVALAAPTGKAAARMKDAIAEAFVRLPALAALAEKLPTEATTIHRLLGSRSDSPFFRHDAKRPLSADVVVIDEASMVDLALMAKLVAAVPESARLILLGDKDQLASVEAGNVLGDICDPAGANDAIVELTTNRRFGNESALYRLSRCVNAGDADGALALIAGAERALSPRPVRRGKSPPGPEEQAVFDFAGGTSAVSIRGRPLPSRAEFESALREHVVEGFRAVLTAADAASTVAHLHDFRILCALRVGPYGVVRLNELAENALADAGLIDPASTQYRGRPILILENDHQLKLFNGDTGVLLPDEEADGELRAYFPGEDGALRRLLPARLPAHETVYAMTVHKSQGSEFGRVLFILPDRETPVLTRELVYTGLTRARDAVELWHDEAVLRNAIARRVERSSGLRDALWKT